MAAVEARAPSVFSAPLRYVQGEGAFDTLPAELARLGAERPMIVCDRVALELVRPRLEACAGATVVTFGGEASLAEIGRVAEIASVIEADAVVGVGGGKALDTAKAVAHPAALPLVIAPTIASTDAPTSALSIIYDDRGTVVEYRLYRRNPDLVIVDTGIIAKAPVRFLVAGMGDGLSTWFEADASARANRPTLAGGPPSLAARALARLCYDTLMADGVAAREAVALSKVTPVVERVVEANTLLSGIGFESGGLAAAHSVHNGLTSLAETHERWHGEKVAFGVLTLLLLEDRPRGLVEQVADFCLRVGLPVTLADFGLSDDPAILAQIAEVACAEHETIHNEPFAVVPEMVISALVAADAFGAKRREYLRHTTTLPAVCS